MIFFTSDTHFGHVNIIKYIQRPFRDAEDMDGEMIQKWNEVVKDDDVVYHLGDFTLASRGRATSYFSRLKGEIHVLGYPWHHDKGWLPRGKHKLISKSGKPVIIEPPLMVLEFKQLGHEGYPKPITLCHYPLARWDRAHYEAWHLHGHSHGKYRSRGFILDVGVDCHDFYPVSLGTVAEIMEIRGRGGE